MRFSLRPVTPGRQALAAEPVKRLEEMSGVYGSEWMKLFSGRGKGPGGAAASCKADTADDPVRREAGAHIVT